MQTRHERRDGMLIFAVTGRMDGATSAAIESALFEQLPGNDSRVALDLSEVTYVNSAGLRVLLKVARHLNDKGALALCGLQPPVRQLLELAGLAKLFAIEPSLDRALARLTPPS